MKLVCPHCSKVVDIADHLAGQTTNCPQCQGPFTVPITAPTPPANAFTAAPPSGPVPPPMPIPPPPPPPAPPDPLGQTTDWRARSGPDTPPPPEDRRRAPSGAAGRLLQRFRTIRIPPAVRDWLGVGTLGVLFLLLFFPWQSISAGDTRLITQSGAGIAFGTTQGDPETRVMYRDLGLSTSPTMFLYFLCVLAGVLLLVVLLLERFGEIPALAKMRPTLRRVAGLRETLVMGLLLATALILLLHFLGLAFPLEQLMQTEKAAPVMRQGLAPKVSPAITSINAFEMVYLQWMSRHGWFYLAVLINLVATAYSLFRWLRSRGHIRRWPRLALQWDDEAPNPASPQLTFDSPMRASELTAPRTSP